MRACHTVAAIAALCLLPACGDDDGDDGGSGTPDAAGGAIDAAGDPADAASDDPDAAVTELEVISPAFRNTEAIPVLHTCQGADVSPALEWSGGPDAEGYAVVLTDVNNQLVHSVIWDIPGDVTSLPEGVAKVAEPRVPAGSKQAIAYDMSTRGYRGPCPGEEHLYEFAVFAVDARPLPDVTLDTERDDLVQVLDAHRLGGIGRLTGSYDPR